MFEHSTHSYTFPFLCTGAGAPILAGREVEAKIDTMEFALHQLVFRIKELVVEYSVTAEMLVKYLKSSCRSLPLDEKLVGNKTMDDIFDVVREECSLLNYSVLQNIALNYGLREAHEFFGLYEEHTAVVTDLLNDTKFAEKLRREVQSLPMAGASSRETISIMTRWGPNQREVQDFKEFMTNAFTFLEQHIHLIDVRPGSMQFICYVPEQLIEAVTQLAYQNSEVFRHFGVIQLTIGGVMVFEQLMVEPMEEVCFWDAMCKLCRHLHKYL